MRLGTDPRVVSDNGFSPLQVAIRAQDLNMLRLLRQKALGAEGNVP